ncbi:MAG: cache domain-containing protein [Pleurocapsa sp.]
MTYQNSTTSLSKADRTSNEVKILPPADYNLPPSKPPEKKPSGLGLRAKTILAAIAIGGIPITTIGAISYKAIERDLTENINQAQQSRANHLALTLETYLLNRTNEAETLAANPIFTNPNVMETVTVGQKKAALDSFQDKTGFYNSIVYLDLQGNPLFQSKSEHPLKNNYSEKEYFQAAISNKRTTLNELGRSSYTGEPRIEFAVPIKHAWTDEVIGIMRFKIPSQNILPLLESYTDRDEQCYVINSQVIFLANSLENLDNQPLANYFPQLQDSHIARKIVTESVTSPIKRDRKQIINYVPVKLGEINPNLNIGTAIALDTDIAFAPLKSLKWIYLGGTIGTILLVSIIAGFLANRIIEPLSKLIAGVRELSLGKLDTKIELNRQDELAVLGDEINSMASQLGGLIQRQKTANQTAELMARIAQTRTPRELQLPFSLFLAEVRNSLKSDRVIFYQFDSQWKGTVVAESVAQGFPRTLGVQFDDHCFAQEYVRKYQKGRIQAISNIYEANLTSCHLQQLEPYGVRASLVLPVILEYPTNSESEKLIGLLIAHQCSTSRLWSQSDVDYLQQIAYQLAMVLRGYVVYQEEKSQKVDFKQDIAQIRSKMKDVALGDLTVKLDSKKDSNRDVIEAFNAVFSNLRQVVEKIQTPSNQIDQNLEVDQHNLAEIKDRLNQQANTLALMFAFIEQMSNSITEISSQVGVASHTVDSVVTDLESEKINFSRAIAFMSQLENNLRHNKDKVRNLSAASGKMTRVISSIRKINLRASLLASKLGKRIPELDESAFSLREEIKSIQQSITATKELENIVLGIDREINEVLQEYQTNENKLEQDSVLIANGSKNLEQKIKITKNAQQNLFSLVNMTKMQQQTHHKIDKLQKELNKTTKSIMLLNDLSIESLEETSVTAKDLENVVNFFKLEEKKLK